MHSCFGVMMVLVRNVSSCTIGRRIFFRILTVAVIYACNVPYRYMRMHTEVSAITKLGNVRSHCTLAASSPEGPRCMSTHTDTGRKVAYSELFKSIHLLQIVSLPLTPPSL